MFYCTILSCSICHLVRRKYAAQKKNQKTAEIYGRNSPRYVLVVSLAGNQPDTFVLRIADKPALLNDTRRIGFVGNQFQAY